MDFLYDYFLLQAFEDELQRRVSDDTHMSAVPTQPHPRKSKRKIKKPVGAVPLPILGRSFTGTLKLVCTKHLYRV